ncbi:Histone-lysine N-methyltransferase SUV39H2 [Orchesella cincta]|uniref:Histone-lysine N-methyltransferase n=1 Tax=Orchesella cincta TaxID=48709 RepID=A0A1D2NHC4_ORCCI|nr:Histone-lysine N-methyltransferase SUV39H2 [Orchesella cincta]
MDLGNSGSDDEEDEVNPLSTFDSSESSKVTLKKRSSSESGGSEDDKEMLPPTSLSSDELHETSSSDDRARSESPETPEDEYELEEIVDFMRDDFGDYYFLKWKGWEAKYNTWEPACHLLNCDAELLRFYKKRKEEVREAQEDGEYELRNGKRRKKVRVRDLPPDPRPFEEAILQWRTKSTSAEAWWPQNKVDKFLENGTDERLSERELKELQVELILIEVNRRKQEWESHINGITGGHPKITMENYVDLTGPPTAFEFVNDYVAGDGVDIPEDPPVGCNCGKGPISCYYGSSTTCCAKQSGYKFAYTIYRKLNVPQGSPIFECNAKCSCGPDCVNRVVQDGKTDHELCIFRTSNGRGWGLKTLKLIKKGSFVTLYVGEVIKSEEAERRAKDYDEAGRTYLFDLDYAEQEDFAYSVDSFKHGNVARFLNHGCKPNLGVYAVWVDFLDRNLPKLAMFALRDIPANEELTFDYQIQLSGTNSLEDEQEPEDNETDEETPLVHRTICLCGAETVDTSFLDKWIPVPREESTNSRSL